jgi:AhpC/TSA family protein
MCSFSRRTSFEAERRRRRRPARSRLAFVVLAFAAALLLSGRGVPAAADSPDAHRHDGVAEKFPDHPAVGEISPDFALKDTEGKPVALGEYLGRGYLILAFGSASSSAFRRSVPELDRLARDWERMEVKVLIVYTREAHPASLRGKAPGSYADRVRLARESRKSLKTELRFLVDGWDDQVHRAYGAMPDAAFLLDRKGVIVARQVKASAVALDRELRRLLEVPDPPPVKLPSP